MRIRVFHIVSLAFCVTFPGSFSLLHTQEWRAELREPLEVSRLSFLNAQNGVAVGRDEYANLYVAYRTTDGGKSWFGLYAVKDYFALASACMADSLNIWLGGSMLRKTTDGGTTWQLLAAPVPSVRCLAFTDPLHGFISGTASPSRSWVYRTTNAGTDWLMSLNIPLAWLNRLYFRTPDIGFTTGLNCIWRTTDAGITWQQVWGGSGSLQCIDFRDSLHGMAAGIGGAVLRTEDGGMTWTKITMGSSSNVMGIAHRSSMEWMLAAQVSGTQLSRSEIYRSTDDGMTFFVTDSMGEWLYDIACPDSSNGICSGEHVIYRAVGGLRETTVRGIQMVPRQKLDRADSLLRRSLPDWNLQVSPARDDSVRLTGICAVPSSLMTGFGEAIILYDTSRSDTGWGGLIAMRAPPLPAGAFSGIAQGDLLRMTGIVRESPFQSSGSMTIVDVLTIERSGSGFTLPPAAAVRSSDFHQGAIPADTLRLSTGEKYEGMIVETGGMTVRRTLSPSSGTVETIDGGGNSLVIADVSPWFTLAAHRDPASQYSPPPAGAHINRLRGVVISSTGPEKNSVSRYRIAPLLPGDLAWDTAGCSRISGVIFNDLNRNGIQDSGETGIRGIVVQCNGKVVDSVITGPGGVFCFSPRDTGGYSISPVPLVGSCCLTPAGWVTPVTMTHPGQTVSLFFGCYFPWNTVAGIVFEDLNENGLRDAGEPGLAGWQVKGRGTHADDAVSDTSGRYQLGQIGTGVDTISIEIQNGWELIVPYAPSSYQVFMNQFDVHLTGFDFAMRRIPHDRVKCTLFMTNNQSIPPLGLNWGVRVGATAGIWGVAAGTSVIDFSEGEFELPTRDPTFFDGRFVGSPDLYGEGSWTDIRQYRLADQRDTFSVVFTPGSLEGGGYPMTFTWDSSLITRGYAGEVRLRGSSGIGVDMKSAGHLVISDPAVGALVLTASGPLIGTDGVINGGHVRRPVTTRLEPPFPNPFNGAVELRYSVSRAGMVRIAIYDLLGRLVALPVELYQNAGDYQIQWNAGQLSGGVYFCRMTTGAYNGVKKLLYIR